MPVLALRERLADAPPQLLVLAAHHAVRPAVCKRSGLDLRWRRARRHHAVRLTIRELEDAACEQLDLALALTGVCVLVGVPRAVRTRRAANR